MKCLVFPYILAREKQWLYLRLFFTLMWPCIVTYFLIMKPTRCTNLSNLFWNENLHVSDSFSVHHQELLTAHSAMVYVIQVCRQLSIRLSVLLDSCLQTSMTYTIAECTVNNSWWWTEELSETCRVSFQNKFEKLVHLFFKHSRYRPGVAQRVPGS
jgi:hypothetical protein